MKKSSTFIYFALIVVITTTAHAQFPQMRQGDERRRQMIAADEARQKEEKGQKPKAAARPVMNVDVQMVLTKSEFKSFAEAKPNATSTFADGDPAWLYIKLNGKLERFVNRLNDGAGGERYLLYAEFGPAGDITAKSHETIEFSKADLALNEFKMSLSPGKAGHNKALAIYIKNVAVSRPGLWHNELRLSDAAAFPRTPGDYLAKTAFNSDFSKGVAKYPAARAIFQSMVLRDSTDETKLPLPGKLDDAAVRAELGTRLSAEGIVPASIYFSDDFWSEYSDNPMNVRQFRTATATYLYRNGDSCLYGTADITQDFEPMTNRFGPSKIVLKKDIPTSCTEFK